MSTAARIDELRSKFDENPRRYFAPLANEYRKAGELVQAIALCREHLPKQPGHMSGHIVFGQALYESGELLESQEIFEAALTLDPENLIALRHLGDIARTRGDSSLARRWYERVLDADPRNDDISALLSSLSQRLTPRSVTPPAAPVLNPYAGVPAEREGANVAAEPDDPFSAPDAPAWHTPSFLTPLASDVVGQSAAPSSPEPVAESQLLDLDLPGEYPDDFEATSLDMSDAESTHESLVQPSDERSELDSDRGDGFGEPPIELASPLGHIESVGASVPESGEAADSLAVALDAFATNDPFESDELADAMTGESASSAFSEDGAAYFVGDAEIDSDVKDAAANATAPTAAFADEPEDFEEGLVAIEWPDANLINSRAITPSRGATPIDADARSETSLSSEELDDAFGAEAGADEVEVEVELEVEVVAESPAAFGAEVEEPLLAVFDSAPQLDDAVLDDTALDEAMIDEDPPLSAAEVPWLAVEEAEREAVDEVALLIDAEEADSDEAASATPAFVTETMAELFVAQGFLDRAVGVYEELVRRRPYDAVLSSRLDELRHTIAAEAEPAMAESADEPASTESTANAWSAPTPLYGVTPVTSSAPLLGATPAWSATPIVNASLTPASLPLVALASQRTARQFFATLAAVRVARRTPSFGTITVASPTPADGLASLFGEVPMPRDDIAARSLAQAFGSGEQIEPGPSLFTPAEPDEHASVGALAPETLATPSASPAAPAFSFDRFFPDPATAGSTGSASGGAASGAAEGAPSGASVIGSGSGSVSPASPSSTAGADLAQFAHWLKGLSNS